MHSKILQINGMLTNTSYAPRLHGQALPGLGRKLHFSNESSSISGSAAIHRQGSKCTIANNATLPTVPVCSAADESLVHIPTCATSDSADFRSSLLSDLRDWIISEQTCPWISNLFCIGLQSWCVDPTGQEPPLDCHCSFIPITQAQLSLG